MTAGMPTLPPAEAVEMTIKVLREMVRLTPAVLKNFDVESFIADQLQPTLKVLQEERWVPVTEKLPDDDMTVRIATTAADEPTWLGFHDEHGWHSVDATPLGGMVTHWKPMEKGPNA